MARTSTGTVTETVKRLLAIEERLHAVETELGGVNGHLEVMTEHLAAQGKTLGAIKTLLEEVLSVRPTIADHERRLHELETRR